MRVSSLVTGKIALWAGLAAIGAVAAPAACFYPGYTFNEPENTGGAGGASTSSGLSSQHSTTSTQTSSGMGGSMSNATSSSASGTGGMLNDCMGTADCSNPMCDAYACVSEAPAGWMGYFTVYDGDAANDPGCPKLYPMPSYQGNGGLNAPSVTCSQCTCGAPTGQTCQAMKIANLGELFVSNDTCLQQTQMQASCGKFIATNTDGACYSGGVAGGANNCGEPMGMSCPGGGQPCNVGSVFGDPMAVGGGCPPSPQVPNKPPATWSSFGRACGETSLGTGCNAGQVCLPKAISPYQSGVCISKPGEVMCPPTFPKQHIYYDSFDDTRDCTPCTCGAIQGASCSMSLNLYSDGGCANLLVSIPAGGCKDLSGNPTVGSRKAVNIAFTGTCQVDASGGKPMGAVTGKNPITYCCK